MCLLYTCLSYSIPQPAKMQNRKCFLKTFLLLAFFSISYSLMSLYILYSHNHAAMPDLFHSAKDVFAPDYLSCYYADEAGNLQAINDSPDLEDSIFFHETNCQSTLSLREACSVESAARAHPDRQVYVVFSRALIESDNFEGVLPVLAAIPNVQFYRVDLNTYAQNTPLQHVFSPRMTWLGKWHYRKIGELLKFLTLFKFGGTVIDLDMMVVGSLDQLGHNWASKLGDNLESGVISVSRGLSGKFYSQEFLKALKHQIVYDGATNAESALQDALKSLCNTTNVPEMERKMCKGFRVYSEEFFNPGHFWDDVANVSTGFLGYHLWDEPRDHHRTSMPSNSLYAKLAKQHCPLTFNRFMSTHDSLLSEPDNRKSPVKFFLVYTCAFSNLDVGGIIDDIDGAIKQRLID